MDYNYTYESNGGGLFAGVLLAIWLLIVIAIYVVTVIGLWKMYVKAGRPGWAAIVPVYNWWVWVEMIGKPRWWFWALVASVLLSWIPVVGIILSLLMFVLYLLGCLEMAKAFDRGSGTGIGLWLVPFVFAPILGFGDAQYVGVAAAPTGGYAAAPPASAGRWLHSARRPAGSAGRTGHSRPDRGSCCSGDASGDAGRGRAGRSGDPARGRAGRRGRRNRGADHAARGSIGARHSGNKLTAAPAAAGLTQPGTARPRRAGAASAAPARRLRVRGNWIQSPGRPPGRWPVAASVHSG